MLQFQHSEYLIGLALLPLFFILFHQLLKQKKETVTKIGDARLVQQLIPFYSHKNFRNKYVLLVFVFALSIIALANPRSPRGSSMISRKGIDVMFALDVSKSMMAQDIKPSRLERAKQTVAKLVDKLSEDRVGIVVFAGKAYLQMPLTTDHAAAKMYLSSASPEVVPTQGTVIGDAINMCFRSFNSNEKKYRSIILISDGEDHDENALKIAASVAEEGVMINTVGIGSPEGSTIVEEKTNEIKKDAEGRIVITKLNETILKEIAARAGGIYQNFTNAEDVSSQINDQLKTLGQKSITENSMLNYTSYFQWFLAIAILFLLSELFITERKKTLSENKEGLNKVSKNTAGSLIILLFLIVPSASYSQRENTLIIKGNEAYINKQYTEASINYEKAIILNKLNEKAYYNLGNSLYKDGQYGDALIAYDKAIKNSKTAIDKANTFYNKGVIYQNEKKSELGIEAYKNALRLNASDEEARHNLQILLEQKRKQEQQKQENKAPKKQDQQNPGQKKKEMEQPRPQASKMTKREAAEKLKALSQQEKNLQDRLRKVDVNAPFKPEKDW
jgi:Ca-activated chloride channel family protein